MKRILLALFSDSGSVSMMRVMSLICCISAVGIAMYGISRPEVDYSGLTILCSSFLSAAFAGKVLQKRIEVASK
jgi:hypothetical protein